MAMDKVDVAIQRLQTASEMSLAVYERPLIITDSGGKDSSVLVHLAKRAITPYFHDVCMERANMLTAAADRKSVV